MAIAESMDILRAVAIIFVVTGLVIAFGLQVLGDVRGDMVTGGTGCNATSRVNCGADYNATGDTMTGVAKFSGKLPLIATVVVAVVIIGMLFMLFRNK